MPREYTETRVNYTVTFPADATGKVETEELFSEVEGSKSLLKKLEDFKAKGAKVEQTRGVTFRLVEATEEPDFFQLVTPLNPDGTPAGEPNREEAFNIFNRGAILKQQKEIRDVMEGTDAIEGVYDCSQVLPKEAERRAADPLTKASRELKKIGIELPPDLLKTILAQYAQQTPSAGAGAGQ